MEALEVLYDQVKTAAGKAPKERQSELLEVCAPLVVFKYLAKKELSANIDALIGSIDTELAAELAKTPGAGVGGSSSSLGPEVAGKAGKKQHKKASEVDGQTEGDKAAKKAMALFGC